MSDEQVTSSVQDRYAPQFAQELARNEQEQKELDERIRQLREDHAALSGLLAALRHETTVRGETVTAPEPGNGEAGTTVDSVPQQRRTRKKDATSNGAAPKRATKATAKPGSAKASVKKAAATKKAVQDKAATDTANAAPESGAPVTGAKGSTGAKKAVGTGPGTGKAAKGTKVSKAAKATTRAGRTTRAGKATGAEKPAVARKSTAAGKPAALKAKAGGTLQDVISGVLAGHAPERRTVREIFDELKQHHPERASSTQSVRNALNGLLRKGAIEREEKQGAVWFGAAGRSSTAPAAAKAKAPDAATAQAAQPAQAAADQQAEQSGQSGAKAAADATV